MVKFIWNTKEELDANKLKEEKLIQKTKDIKKIKDMILEKQVEEYLTSEELSEEEKDLFVSAYDEWEPEEVYKAGDRVSYNGSAYEVIQAHTSQKDWTPEIVPALFRIIYQTKTSGGEEVIPDFVQPTGAHDAYKKGDRVSFKGSTYESTMDGNVWSPESYPQAWTKL